MTADIIQLRDHQSRRQREQVDPRLVRQRQIVSEFNLEQQAIEIMNIALLGEPTMIGMEPVIYLNIDTAPAEYCAPDKDSA